MRDIMSRISSAKQAPQAKFADYLSKKSGEQTNFFEQNRQQAKDYSSQRRQAQTGVPEGPPMKAMTGDHQEMPGAIRSFLETGGRVLGAGVTHLADKAGTEKRAPTFLGQISQMNRANADFGESIKESVFDTSKTLARMRFRRTSGGMTRKRGRPDMPEIRVEVDIDDVNVLDGYCTATGKSRTDVIRTLLREWSARKLHEATIVLRVAGRHPGHPESVRNGGGS
jgi:hypothetical protein